MGEQLRHRQQTQASYDPKGAASLFGKRYLHFDFAVSDAELVEWQPILLDPKQVRQRAFYPFLKMVKQRKRYQKDESGIRRPAPPKQRELCYAAHHDALFYSWYGFQLETLLEPRLHVAGVADCVLAYRTQGRNNLHFAKDVFDYIATQASCVALAFDVTKFFDTLDHRLLKQAWVDLLQERELPPDHYTNSNYLPLQYLGLEYCGRTIRLRASSLARYHQRLRRGVRKAVRKAKGIGGKDDGKVYRRKLYERFTHLGKTNFITYAERAYDITGSEAIRQQVSGGIERVQAVIRSEETRYASRRRNGVVGGKGHHRTGF